MGLQMSCESSVLTVTAVEKKYQLHATPWKKLMHLALGGRWVQAQEFLALTDISFDVGRGESLGIIGSNGSGKSTLLQLIAGTLTPTSGTIAIKGRVAALLELGAGFNPELTGRENLLLGAHLHGVDAEQIDVRVADMVTFADIGDFIDQPVKFYSSGMFVRVAFALVAHVDADVLIVDEALAVGDAMFAQKCMRYMSDFMQRGTLIFVSHDMASVRSLCNRVIWLDKGQVMAVGDPKSVGDAYLEQCYAQQQPVALKTASAPQLVQEELEPTQKKAVGPQEDFRLQGAINPLHIKAVPVFDFGGFGAGQARIDHVVLHDEWGQNLKQTEGGRKTSLRIEAQLHANLDELVFGYFIRNRMGLNIFGDNTFLAHAEQPVSGQAGERVCAVFEFIMPFLPKGEYSICVALATGSNQQHVQQHWVNEALIIQSIDNHVHADVMALPSISMVIRKA